MPNAVKAKNVMWDAYYRFQSSKANDIDRKHVLMGGFSVADAEQMKANLLLISLKNGKIGEKIYKNFSDKLAILQDKNSLGGEKITEAEQRQLFEFMAKQTERKSLNEFFVQGKKIELDKGKIFGDKMNYLSEYEYDANGMLRKEFFLHSNGNKLFDEYDENGRKTKTITKLSDGDKKIIEYGISGKKTKETFTRTDGKNVIIEYAKNGKKSKVSITLSSGKKIGIEYDADEKRKTSFLKILSDLL